MLNNTNWQVIFHTNTQKQLKKIEPFNRDRIFDYLEKVVKSGNPRQFGLAMTGHRKAFWRYRIGEYRTICRLQDDKLIVVAVKVGHRKDVYRSHEPLP